VRKHLENVYAKLGVTTRTQAAMLAIETCVPATAEDQLLQSALLQSHGKTQEPSLDAYGLTGQEARILALLATGRSNDAIASELAISPLTVRKHVEHIYSKLQVRRRTDAAIRALRLDPPRPERDRRPNESSAAGPRA
jgi:DNA-binding NarL/FixJ family response regulator